MSNLSGLKEWWNMYDSIFTIWILKSLAVLDMCLSLLELKEVCEQNIWLTSLSLWRLLKVFQSSQIDLEIEQKKIIDLLKYFHKLHVWMRIVSWYMYKRRKAYMTTFLFIVCSNFLFLGYIFSVRIFWIFEMKIFNNSLVGYPFYGTIIFYIN